MRIEKQNPGFAKRVKSWLTGKYVENGSTASQNIPAGKWVTWKGQVCRSKAAITTGDTLSSTNLATDEEGMINNKASFPNYYHDTHEITDFPFTAPCDCFAFINVKVTNWAHIHITHNGSTGFAYAPPQGDSVVTLFLQEGDIVLIGGGAASNIASRYVGLE